MIPKNGYRFSEKITLEQQPKAKWRFNLKSFRFSSAVGVMDGTFVLENMTTARIGAACAVVFLLPRP
jgi:hypothetical protein